MRSLLFIVHEQINVHNTVKIGPGTTFLWSRYYIFMRKKVNKVSVG